jgi:hypothetical protein
MAIGNLQIIDIGLQNESAGSDSLYLAFNKTKNNFAILANVASPYVNFVGNTGINVANTTDTITITNTGVLSLTAGDSSINLSGSNGNITITATGGGNGGGVSSIGINSSTLSVNTTTGGNIVSSGNIIVNLTSISPTLAGTYTYPTVTVDQFGRVTTIANAASVGTVTSVGISPGAGISVTNSPITTSGDITVINTGVTRLSAGSGIQVSSGNGNVTISTTPVAAVTSVSVASTSLTVTGSPITGSGTITVDLPSNISITGNIIGGNIDIPNGRANVTGTANAVGGGATVGVRSILAIDSAFGSNNVNDPASAQAVRGRVTGSNLTKTRNYVAGVTGQYLVTGTNASEFINTGLLGVVGDQTTTANAAVVAYLDGDGGLTTAGSAYGVSMKNSTPGSGFDYGLDLQFINLNVVGTTTPFKQADIRFNNGVTLVANTAGNISINANVTVGNIIATNIGNIANINLDGNVSNVLRGDGTWGADANSAYGDSNVVTLLGAFGSNTIVTSGAANVGNLSATGNISGGNLVLTTGNIIYTPRYGSFYSNTTQTNPVANTAMAMTFNNTNSANGVSVVSNSQLTVAKAGVYNIQFSAQCTKTDAGTDYLEIWLSKNGNAVASTSTRLKLNGSNVYEIAAWNFVETLGAGEYVQVMWGSADLNAQLVAIPSANTTMGIDVPSVIVTVTPVGA